jgi:hypothetical protein
LTDAELESAPAARPMPGITFPQANLKSDQDLTAVSSHEPKAALLENA